MVSQTFSKNVVEEKNQSNLLKEIIKIYQAMSRELAEALKNSQFKQIEIIHSLESFQNTLEICRSTLQEIQDARNIEELLTKTIDQPLCIFYMENEGPFLCTQCEFQTKVEFVSRRHNFQQQRTMIQGQQVLFLEEKHHIHADIIERNAQQWIGYTAKMFHTRLKQADNEEAVKKNHFKVTSINSFIQTFNL